LHILIFSAIFWLSGLFLDGFSAIWHEKEKRLDNIGPAYRPCSLKRSGTEIAKRDKRSG
jgi:hypothetical protein